MTNAINQQTMHASLNFRKNVFHRQTVFITLLIANFFFLGVMFNVANILEPRIIWFITGAFGLFSIGMTKGVLKIHWLHPIIMYASIFWVFHFGLLFPASISLDILEVVAPGSMGWVYQTDTTFALLGAMIFANSFLIGTIVSYKKSQALDDVDQSQELIKIGWILIWSSLLLVAVAIANYGVRVFLNAYENFYSIHNSFSWPIVIMATGFMLQIAGGRDRGAIVKNLLLLFLPIIIPVFGAGARTAPLFSSAAIIAMLTIRGFQPPLKIIIPGTLLILVMIATVRDVRQQGVGTLLNQNNAVQVQDPLAGLTEMGGSLRPVSVSIDYIRDRGNVYFNGATYVFPFTRQLERFTGSRGTTLTDERFIASRINQIYGSIGFSTVAEAYINFGILGIFLFAIAWGAILSHMISRASTPYRQAVVAIILIPMFINVRNSFIYVPAWILLGLVPIFIAYQLHTFSHRRKSIPLNATQSSIKHTDTI